MPVATVFSKLLGGEVASLCIICFGLLRFIHCIYRRLGGMTGLRTVLIYCEQLHTMDGWDRGRRCYY
jgi:hypothetical protein